MLSMADLNYPAIGKPAKTHTLAEPLRLPSGTILPTDTAINLRQTRNFGFVVYKNNQGRLAVEKY